MDIVSGGSTITLLAVLSFLIYAIVELLLSPLLWENDPARADLRKVILQVAAAAIGVVFAVAFQIDLFTEVIGIFKPGFTYSGFAHAVGMICTGLLVGRGSDWLHALRKLFSGGDDPGAGMLTQ